MMKELEETNCEIRQVTNFEFQAWKQLENLVSKDELVSTDGSKESSLSQVIGGFLNKDCKYGWLCHDKRLIVIDVKHGKCICSWDFEYRITTVTDFPCEEGQIPLLLVGLDNNAIRIKDSIGHLCIFDCCMSVVLTTIQVPAGVEKASVIHGGTEWEEYIEKRPETVLAGNSGLIFAALRNLQHIVIDINRLSWDRCYMDGQTVTGALEFVNSTPVNVNPSLNRNEGNVTHFAYNLMDTEIEQFMGFDREEFEATPLYDENLCSVLLTSPKIGCLITGCLGRVIIWQSDGSIGWISPAFDENAYVTHIALLEPSDDPRPFYYLWIACQSDAPDSSAVLRMYAMLFNSKHLDKSNESSIYFNLESEPSLKFELELEQGERIHTLQSVERENFRDIADMTSRHGEDSLLLIGSGERVLLFDLNRWYKEQMPRTMAECRNPNSVMASYRTNNTDEESKKSTITCSFVPDTLKEFSNKGPSSPEELFYPNSLMLEWVDLSMEGLTYWLARGVQAELLREITIAGPIVLVKPAEIYRRCLNAGLVPFDSTLQDYSPNNISQSEQREMLLSLCLEQQWTHFLIHCATEWSDGSASFLYPEFLRWGVERASQIKLLADHLCVTLFDQSGISIGETELKILRFCAQQLECLASVVSRLPNLEGDLERQRRALKRLACYLQVLIWFYDVGLLPETQDIDFDDNLPQFAICMKIPYPKDKLVELYQEKRGERNIVGGTYQRNLFIDHLLTSECQPLLTQWEREAQDSPNPGGSYPPPSLQSLLRSFLTDCYRDEHEHMEDLDDDSADLIETEVKHCITIYLMMDLAMLLQNSHPGIDNLIKYPSAFMLKPSLIKLTQAFWLLDHNDFEGFFKIITGQLIVGSDIKDWHHKLAIETLFKFDQHKLALVYLKTMKPPLSSLDDQSTVIGLTVESGLVQSAFHLRPPSQYSQLLVKFFNACKANGKLKYILLLSLDQEEEETFLKFLKEDGGCEETRLLYYLQRNRHTEAGDIYGIDTDLHPRRQQSGINSVALKLLEAFKATLPNITKCFANNLVKTSSVTSPPRFQPHKNLFPHATYPGTSMGNSMARNYPRPMSQCVNQTIEIYELAITKARETFLKTSDRPNGGCPGIANYVPFLGAPCSTVFHCTRMYNSNNANANRENFEANCVLYPERKAKGKRTLRVLNEDEENIGVDDAETKRRRLGSVSLSEPNLPVSNSSLLRRMSMSQVCDTPLVQRRIAADGKDANGLTVETPHSILKIRQMFSRNSNSPGFGFGSAEKVKRYDAASGGVELRPPRQIRFSIDRQLDPNDDSAYSISNDSNKDQNEQESNVSVSSKQTEEGSYIEETYYSPDVSMKSIREASILSDSSITKSLFRGPRPRPGLRRRSSVISHASSDCQSHKTALSDDSTLSASALDSSLDTSKKSTLSSRKSALSSTIYAASILCPNTSDEGSPIKKMSVNVVRRDETVTTEEESDDQTEEDEEVVAEIEDTGVDKESSVEPVVQEIVATEVFQASVEGEKDDEEEKEQQDEVEEMEIQYEHEVQEQNFVFTAPAQPEQVEEEVEVHDISDDDDNEVEEMQEKSASSAADEPQVHDVSDDDDDEEEEEEEEEKEATAVAQPHHHHHRQVSEDDFDPDESFQSFNSLDNAIAQDTISNITATTTTITTTTHHSIDHRDDDVIVEEDVNYSLTTKIIADERVESYNYDEEYSLTKNFVFARKALDESTSSQHSAYSLTKPIFIDDKGMVKCDEIDEDVTDEQSDDLEKPEESDDEDEDAVEVRLNVSTSDGSDDNAEKQPKEDLELPMITIDSPSTNEENTLERENSLSQRVIEETSPKTVGRSRKQQQSITPTSQKKVEVKGTRTRLSSALSDDVFEDAGSTTPLRRSSRNRTTSKDSNVDSSPISAAASAVKSSDDSETSIGESPKAVERKERGKRSGSSSRDTKSKQVEEEKQQPTVERKTRKKSSREPSQDKSTAAAQIEESIVEQKSTRSTRASQKEVTAAAAAAETSKITRSTRGGSVVKEQEKAVRKTRAGSVAQDEEVIPAVTTTRKTRTASVTQDEEVVPITTTTKKTTGASVSKDEDPPKRTRGASVAKDEESRKTRAASVVKDDDTSMVRTTRATRAGSVMKDQEVAAALPVRKTRGASVAKDEDTSVRKTRGASVAKDEDMSVRKTRGALVAKAEDTSVRKTRAASVVKDEETTRKTRGMSVSKDEETTRKTRAGSVAQEDEGTTSVRKTRAASVVKDDETTTTTSRKTRGTSVAKDEETAKRSTRVTSVAKDKSTTEELDETATGKRQVRKRGNSVPKDTLPPVVEALKAQSRSRRSTSLLKEVILEESMSQLGSPLSSSKRGRTTRATSGLDSVAVGVSSPAANTRSRRSSIQSIPDEVNELQKVQPPAKTKKPNEPQETSSSDQSRSRRAASVDSSVVVVPTGKRVTRSKLAKTSIIEEVILEEAVPEKKRPVRRKRATSVPAEGGDEQDDKVKAKPDTKSKRGRKASESKDFQFSPPEEAGEVPSSPESGCRTPVFKFSEPQKFISLIVEDNDNDDEESERALLGRNNRKLREPTVRGSSRRPRKEFVLPKTITTKDKAK